MSVMSFGGDDGGQVGWWQYQWLVSILDRVVKFVRVLVMGVEEVVSVGDGRQWTAEQVFANVLRV